MEKSWTASDRILSNIPEDIILNEIFPRLPAKSFYLLGCVSKRFRSLTSHPPILDAFRRRAGGRHVLSFESALENVTVFYYSEPERQSKIADSRSKPIHYIYVKFINGLVCLVQGNHAVIIRNAATEQKFHLPLLRPNYPKPKIFTYFCYDPGSNSVGADKSWRKLSDPDLQQLGKSRSVCIKGVLFCTDFWSRKRIEGGVIAAFDVGSERFSSVEYPK